MRTEERELEKGLTKWRKLRTIDHPGLRVRVTEAEVDALCDHFSKPELIDTPEASLFWSRVFTGPLDPHAIGKTGTHFMALRAEPTDGGEHHADER